MENINEIMTKWERTGRLSQEEAITVYKSVDAFVDFQIEQISELARMSKPELAFSCLNMMTGFLSAAATKVPGIIGKLQKSIGQYQSQAHALGKKLNAESLTISVGFPSGVTIALTWKI